MRILLGFFIVLILLAGLEIYSISLLAHYINLLNTVIIILVTGIIGACIARKNAKEALQTLMKGDFSSSAPAKHIFDVLAFFLAAALLLIPGIITDIAGLILLIPWTRNFIYKRIIKGKKLQNASFFDNSGNIRNSQKDKTIGNDEVIDIEAEDA